MNPTKRMEKMDATTEAFNKVQDAYCCELLSRLNRKIKFSKDSKLYQSNFYQAVAGRIQSLAYRVSRGGTP